MIDLTIKNGKIFVGELFEGGIGIDEGKIVAICKDSVLPPSDKTIDAKGMIVIPGAIDVDCHLREPGATHKEDFFTGTSAAAAGGVTTVLDMPNNVPPITTAERLKEKEDMVRNKAVVDYGFHFGGAVDNSDEVEKVDDIVSVKIFMAGHKAAPTFVANEGIIYELFLLLAKKGIPCAVHAEHQNLIDHLQEKYKERSDYEAYNLSRNNLCAALAVSEVIEIAKFCGTRIHICHVSAPEELRLIKAAKDLGFPISCEAVPYHLFLTVDDLKRLKGFGKVSPPLRSKSDREFLWKALESGWVDCIASEHTPHTKEEKELGVWEAPPGMPSLETMLPLLFYKGLPLADIVRMTSENPARIFKVKNKGKIALGYDADLVILNPKREWIVKSDELKTKCGWSAFESWTLKGKPEITILRGNSIYKNGEITDKVGRKVSVGF